MSAVRSLVLTALCAATAASLTLSVAAVRQTSAALKSADDEKDRAVRYKFEYQHVLQRLERLEAQHAREHPEAGTAEAACP